MKEAALLQACALLFGEEVVIGPDFLDYLQPAGLQQAYRQRARETHPDSALAAAVGNRPPFHDVQQAYQLLSAYLRQRALWRSTRKAAAAPRPRSPVSTETAGFALSLSLEAIKPIILSPPRYTPSTTVSIDRLYQGPLPQRSLLFGHFLYYCGLTTWRTITAVLVHQRRGRLRCGELGAHYGLLQPADIHRILQVKPSHTPFGEVAKALGLLDEGQLHALLMQQRRQQKKFGTILVEHDLLSLRELTFLLTQFRSHNRLHGSR